jgi:general secretion pathway protein A
MYEARFGLEGLPFQIAPDLHFHVDTDTHRAALSALQAGLARGDEFIALVGDFGTGKTMVARRLIQLVDRDRYAVVELAGWRIEGDDLLTRIAGALGQGAADTRLPLGTLMQCLQEIGRRDRAVLLVIDDAHLLGLDAVRRLAKLTAMRADGRGVVHVCLVGRSVPPAIAEHLRVGRPLRIETLAQLDALDAKAVSVYIRGRLERVGWTGSPSFAPGAAAEIQARTAGNPARINRLCGHLLAQLQESGDDVVSVELVRAVADRLQSEFDDFLADGGPGPPTLSPPVAAWQAATRTTPAAPPAASTPLPEIARRDPAARPASRPATLQEAAVAMESLLNIDLLPEDGLPESPPLASRPSGRALATTNGRGALMPQPVTGWKSNAGADRRRAVRATAVLLTLGGGLVAWQWRQPPAFTGVDVRHVAMVPAQPSLDIAAAMPRVRAPGAALPTAGATRPPDAALSLELAPPAAGARTDPQAAAAGPAIDVAAAPAVAPGAERPRRRLPAHARVSAATLACSLEAKAMGLCRAAPPQAPARRPAPEPVQLQPPPAAAPPPPQRAACSAAQSALGLCNP